MTKLPRALDGFFALPFTDTINALSLGAGVAETMTVPSGAHFVAMSATADFYAKWTAAGTTATAATVPGDTTDGTGAALNPTLRRVSPGDSISVISAVACVVTFEFFQRDIV